MWLGGTRARFDPQSGDAPLSRWRRRLAVVAGAGAMVLAGALLHEAPLGTARALAQEHDEGGGHGGHGGRHGGMTEEEWLQHRGEHEEGGEEGHSGGEHAGRGGRDPVEEWVFRREGGRSGQGRGGNGLEGSVFADRGRPDWAGGAVPEDIELGRLNAGRAPQSVRVRALEEAYRSILDRDGDGQIDPGADLGAVESPNANLALYQQAIDGDRWTLDDAAGFLGRAAEKNQPIGTATIFAVHVILGLEDPELVFAGYGYERAVSVDAGMLAAVFGGENVLAAGVGGFAQAADDVRAIEKYVHDHAEGALIN